MGVIQHCLILNTDLTQNATILHHNQGNHGMLETWSINGKNVLTKFDNNWN
jgi:hypothetical protein